MKIYYKIFLNWLSLIFIFILIFVFCFRTIGDIDICYHLRGDQLILENKSFYRNDVFTYTVNKNKYIALHWPFQILLYLVYRIAGYNGLTIYTVVIFLIKFLLMLFVLKKRNVSNIIFSLVVFLSLFAFELRFRPKPETFTYLFLVITIFILDEYYYNNKNLLFLLSIIKILWTNFHGLFIIGDFFIFSYLISKIIHKGFDKGFLIWSFTSLFSSLILITIKVFFFHFILLQGCNHILTMSLM